MTRQEKLTKNQGLVYDCLKANGRAMTAYDLLDQLRENGIKAPMQIYRALEGLSDKGKVHRIETMNAFIACNHAHHDEAAAFAVCQECGHVEEFCQPLMNEKIGEKISATGFNVHHAVIELRGLCSDCCKDQ